MKRVRPRQFKSASANASVKLLGLILKFTRVIHVYNKPMQKKLTITIDEKVYEGLYEVIGRRNISQFIESLLRPHVLLSELEEGYRAMAADEAREAEALLWSEALIGDVANEAR